MRTSTELIPNAQQRCKGEIADSLVDKCAVRTSTIEICRSRWRSGARAAAKFGKSRPGHLMERTGMRLATFKVGKSDIGEQLKANLPWTWKRAGTPDFRI